MADDWWAASVIFPHYLLAKCIEGYGEVWSEALAKRAKQKKRVRVES